MTYVENLWIYLKLIVQFGIIRKILEKMKKIKLKIMDSMMLDKMYRFLPRAIAPPLMFIFDSSIFSSLLTDNETAAKASFNSNKSTSSLVQPAFCS